MLFCQKERQKFCWNVISKGEGSFMYSKHLEHYSDADQTLTMYIVVSKRHYFANKGPSSQDYGFPSSHV